MEEIEEYIDIKALWQVHFVKNGLVVISATIPAYNMGDAVKAVADAKAVNLDEVDVYAREIGYPVSEDNKAVFKNRIVGEVDEILDITDIKERVIELEATKVAPEAE